jgi:hypothetical protein
VTNKNGDTHNVVSHNQSGGITAHTVNIGKPAFTLSNEIKSEIERIVGNSLDIKIILVGDHRKEAAFALVANVAEHLKKPISEVTRIGMAIGIQFPSVPYRSRNLSGTAEVYFNTNYW